MAIKSKTQFALFFLGFGLFAFTRRSELVPTLHGAVIIAPVFILRFIRTQPKNGSCLTLLGFLLSMNIALFGLFTFGNTSMTLIFNLLRSSLLAILYFLPFVLDRVVYRKFTIKTLVATLVFPVMTTAVFFIASLEGPFDGETAKNIYAEGPAFFIQLASIFGLWGFVFIFSWFASIINLLWENGFHWTSVKKPVSIFLLTVLMISLYGIIKISPLVASGSDTVKIASIVLIPNNRQAISIENVFTISPYDETLSRIENLTRMAARNAAKIVSFQEFAIIVEKERESILRQEFQRIARENNIYLNITYAWFSENERGENKNLLIDTQGNMQIDYTKRYLFGIGGVGETKYFRKGPERIQSVDTPYGRIGVATCRDMNFPPYLRQAGRRNVDVILGPSYDFPKSTSPSYYLRAIENGFSFVRATCNGISFAEDYNGTILARMDSGESADGIMYADIPTKGIKTIYTRIGDVLGWICVGAFCGFLLFTITKGKTVLRLTKNRT